MPFRFQRDLPFMKTYTFKLVRTAIAALCLFLGGRIATAGALDHWLGGSITSEVLTGVTYGNGTYVAVGYNGEVWTSPNAITWTNRTFDTNVKFLCITFANGVFVAGGGNFGSNFGGTLHSSTDGIHWTAFKSGYCSFYNGISFLNGAFRAVANQSHVSTSSDGFSWDGDMNGYSARIFQGVAFGNATYAVAGKFASGAIYSSTNAVNNSNFETGLPGFSDTAPSNTNPLSGIAFGNGIFVAVGGGGTVLTSTDAFTWTSRPSGTTNDLRAVTFGPGFFMAVGAGGTVLTSEDGIVWELRTIGTAGFRGVVYVNDTFLAAGESGFLMHCPYPLLHPVIALEHSVPVPLDGSTLVGFDPAIVGSTTEESFTIRNNGTADLTGLALKITGSNLLDFTASSPTPSKVPPGGNASFSVRFKAKAAGTRNATLHLSSNDPAHSPVDVQLAGDGVSFASQAGVFNGVFSQGNGYLSLKLTGNGQFTGKLVFNGASIPLKGSLDVFGNYNGSAGLPPVSLGLNLGAGTGGYLLTGSVAANALTAYRAAYGKGQTAAETGKYSILLSATDTSPSIPQGTGYAMLNVSKTGGVTMAGKLADGEAVSVAGVMVGGSTCNQFMLFNPLLYKKNGLLAGAINFESLPNSDCNALLDWKRPVTGGSYYPTGFETGITLAGARYAKPIGIVPLPFVNGSATLSSGGLGQDIVKPISLSTSSTVLVSGSNPEMLKITINASSGGFSGSFLDPVTKKPLKFAGMLYQNINTPQAGGFFLGPISSGTGYSGNVSLTPN
jgi:hypothetical protein